MWERLRRIIDKYGIDPEDVLELQGMLGIAVHRTHRLDDDAPDGERVTSAPEALYDRRSRYVDEKPIGRGGFSQVTEVRDLHVLRTVAMKMQLPERSSPDDCKRFLEEVRITARLQHPGVVPVHDWGEEPDGRVWFTMKRVNGDTISHRIATLHELTGSAFVQSLRRLLDDFRRLCEPVAYAHAQRIIHRDIKPENLMIGELGEVHVMDWGLARDLDRRSGHTSYEGPASVDGVDPAHQTQVAGTPCYMPPEQANGDLRAMSPASDVYALGAVLYEILSGQPPYLPRPPNPPDWGHLLSLLLYGPPAPIEEVARPEAPKALFALCRKAMERDPANRYPDAGALMEAVRDWLDGTDRRDRARRIVNDAERQHHAHMAEQRETVERLRAEARTVLDKLRSFDKAQLKAEGWKLEDDAAAIEQQVMREEIEWTQKVRSALNEVPDLEEAHTALSQHYAAYLLRAEGERDQPSVTRYAALLDDHARRLPAGAKREHYEALVRGDGKLTLLTEPDGAEATILPLKQIHRYLTPFQAEARTVRTPVYELSLQHGSYLVLLKAAGRDEVRYPVEIRRNEHWDGVRPGKEAPRPIRLPRSGELQDGDVYVPAGWFIAGGDPRAAESSPRRRIWVDAFVMRRNPVTNAEYVEFLNALIAEGRIEEARARCPRQSPVSRIDGEGARVYAVDESSGRYSLRDPAAEGALPVVFVDWYDAMAYAADRARRSGLPWRLPSELEWEKAARGVDGRFMPWGDQIEPTWACISDSHPLIKRLLPVDAYPTDVSVYGVYGMAGNARDWCIERWALDGPHVEESGLLKVEQAGADDAELRATRGGAWISAGDLARLAVRYAAAPTMRYGVQGFRLARSITE